MYTSFYMICLSLYKCTYIYIYAYIWTTPPLLPALPRLHVDAPTLHPTWPLNSLELPVSWGFGASSLNEHKPRSPLLYVCWGLHISWCMLSVWWSNVWKISGVQLRLPVLLYGSLSPQLLSAFPNSTTGFSCSVHWLGTNICMWLFQLLVGSFRGQSVMLGPFLWALHSLSKSQALGPPLELDPTLGFP